MKKIVLCGNSVVMGGFAASLQAAAGVELAQSSDAMEASAQRYVALSRDLHLTSRNRYGANRQEICVEI